MAIEVSGCRLRPSFLSVFGGSSEHTCGKYIWVKELLNLGTEIQEQMGRLRSIREFEKGEPG